MTPLPVEIALCDAAEAPCGGWTPTGYTFDAFASGAEPDSSVAVCRFYNDRFAPRSSHFYALHGAGCEATLQDFPDWQLESANLFAMDAPLPDGSCEIGIAPVFRLYNNGMGGAPNHRFTSDAGAHADGRKRLDSRGCGCGGRGVLLAAIAVPLSEVRAQSRTCP
ncbi:MAG TPA: hypothetical protein VIL19_09865 [Casimicrobiaceae bacterium]